MSVGNSWDELEVGSEAPVLDDGPLTITDFVRYQGASGDMNPIHHDVEFARRSGYPTPFAVGMRQAGILSNLATAWLGARNLRRFKVQFREQAWPGDTLTYSGVITAKREEAGERLVELEMAVTRQTGGVHLRGWATFSLDS
ncbi:MAG TPA: MaoC/PaaZ C-terminal domain-containing protein [Acidimicrobiales bacterium]|nr:MaoC/PaaZ C-terminal domain-containing protein [Acidimicrobiales bacterium]